MNGAGDLLPNRNQLHIGVAKRHHHIQARHSIARRVGVNRRETTVVARVHGLQHVQGFLAADLSHHNPVRPHTQAIHQELSLSDGAVAFQIGGPCLQPGNVWLFQLKLGGILNRHDALTRRDEAGQGVQQRRLACARSSQNDDIEVSPDGGLQQRLHSRGESFLLHQIVESQLVFRELTNRQQRAVHRKRRDDRIDTRAVQQASIHHRIRLVQPAADLRDDLVDDPQQVRRVEELHRC
jgi:hypothetical protein